MRANKRPIGLFNDLKGISIGVIHEFTTTRIDGVLGGPGGGIDITAGRLTLIDNCAISASTFGGGRGGDVVINAGAVTLIDGGIYADTDSQALGAPGGNLRITTGALTTKGGGVVSASTTGPNQSGNISINASAITLAGSGNALSSGGVHASTTSSGKGGDIQVTADRLRLTGGAEINAETGGVGPAGKVDVHAGNIFVSGPFSGIFSSSSTAFGGAAGQVTVSAGTITLAKGGEISTTTFGTGAGGDIRVTADVVNISGLNAPKLAVDVFGSDVLVTALVRELMKQSPRVPTGIFAASLNPTLSAPAGRVYVDAGSVSIVEGGAISSSSFGPGAAGDVNVAAGRLLISGGGAQQRTGIASTSESSDVGRDAGGGPGGNVNVKASLLEIRAGGEISALTRARGNGGSISIMADTFAISGDESSRFTGVDASTFNPGRGGDGGAIHVATGGGSAAAGRRNSPRSSGRASSSWPGSLSRGFDELFQFDSGSSCR